MAMPTVAVGSETTPAGVVHASGVAVTTMVKVPERIDGWLDWSVTCTPKVYEPAPSVGEPVIAPIELFTVSPAGSVPVVMV